MTKQVVLRYPDGEDMLTTDKIGVMQDFITWIIACNHFSDHSHNADTGDIFIFPKSTYGIVCRIKWKRLNILKS